MVRFQQGFHNQIIQIKYFGYKSLKQIIPYNKHALLFLTHQYHNNEKPHHFLCHDVFLAGGIGQLCPYVFYELVSFEVTPKQNTFTLFP